MVRTTCSQLAVQKSAGQVRLCEVAAVQDGCAIRGMIDQAARAQPAAGREGVGRLTLASERNRSPGRDHSGMFAGDVEKRLFTLSRRVR